MSTFDFLSVVKAVKDVRQAMYVLCDRIWDGGEPSTPELATEIFKMMIRLMKPDWDAGVKDGVIVQFAIARRGDDLYCALEGLMKANTNNHEVARHALQAITYLAKCEQGKEQLVSNRISRCVEKMMMNFGESDADLAEWGFYAIQALTSLYEDGRKSFSEDVPPMMIRILKTHVTTSSVHPGVAKISMYPICNLCQEKCFRTLFNADGASDVIVSLIITNPLITDEKIK